MVQVASGASVILWRPPTSRRRTDTVLILAVLALAVALGAVVQGSIGFGYALLAVLAMALLLPWAVPVRPCCSPPLWRRS